MRYEGWIRRRRSAGTSQEAADQRVAEGRKLLGELMHQLKLAGIRQGKMQRTLPDGSVITAQFDGTTPMVHVDAPQQEGSQTFGRAGLWAPRGFIVRPADVAAPHGRGLPVVQSGTDPYRATNLRPGLDPARWTPGGPWNQVLITSDRAAGYPPEDATAAPMYFSPLGPNPRLSASYDARASGTTWDGYRPDFVDFRPRSPKDNIGDRRQIFAQVNAFRVNAGLSAAYLMPRGFYRPAQELAVILTFFGTKQASFPLGYQTMQQRKLKDGAWQMQGGPYTELAAVGGSVVWVMNDWTTTQAAQLKIDAGHVPIVADVGSHDARTTLTLQPREDWIKAGRRVFQPADSQLPPISWDGPPSLNVGFMTWPVAYRNQTVYSPASLYDGNGKFYVRFATSTYGSRPALGPFVYCRGRVLGELPDQGLVLGAGVQTLADRDRLIVIAHQPADNVGLTSATDGLTAKLHVWYADFKKNPELRLHSEQPVTVWKDAGMLVVPGIHYLSLWAFKADGSTACALRDFSDAQAVADAMSVRLTAAQAAGHGFWSFSTNDNLIGDVHLLELSVAADLTCTISTTSLAYGTATPYTDQQLAHAPSGFPSGASVTHNGLAPLAAAYDAQGAVRVAYIAFAKADVQLGQQPGDKTTWQYLFDGISFQYVGTGGIGAQFERDLDDLTLYSTDNAVPELDFFAAGVQLLDVATCTYVVSGARNVRAIDYAGIYQYGTYQGAPYRAPFTFSAAAPTCVLETTEASHLVRIYRQGALVDESAYAHPYGALWHFYYMCNYAAPPATYVAPGSDILARFPAVMDQFVQPFYAERFGKTVFGYQVGQQAAATDYALGTCMPGPTDYNQAISNGTTQTTSEEGRHVIGGKWWQDFNFPAIGADWLAEVVVA